MNLALKIFLIILLIALICVLINTLKEKKMSMRYFAFWVLLIILMFALILFPGVIIVISRFLGFEATSNMIFLVGYFILFYIVFNQSIELSKRKNETVKLIQEISILKNDVKIVRKR